MHQIWSDKYMKSQSIRNLISANFYQKNARKITPSCLVTLKRSTDSILIFLHRQLRYNFWRYSVPFLFYFVPCRCFFLPFYAILSPFLVFYKQKLRTFVAKPEICTFFGVKLSKADKSTFFKLLAKISISVYDILKLSVN